MQLKHHTVVIGKIGSSFGIKGWVRIQSHTTEPDSIVDYQPWFLKSPQGQWEPIEIEKVEFHHKGIVAKMVGVETPEQARLFTGREIGVNPEVFPKAAAGEYYWQDLYGMQVLTTSGELLGEVTGLMETGANDVLVCQGKKEYLIPFVKEVYIMSVNLDKRQIVVNWESDY